MPKGRKTESKKTRQYWKENETEGKGKENKVIERTKKDRRSRRRRRRRMMMMR